jgi:cytochrome c556
MKRILGALTLGLVLSALAHAADDPPKNKEKGKDTFENVIKEMIPNVKDLGKVLESITDEKSAKTATPKMVAIAKKLLDSRQRMMKLGKPSEADEEAIKTKYLPDLMPAQQKVSEEVKRLSESDYGKGVIDALKKAMNPALKKDPDKDK